MGKKRDLKQVDAVAREFHMSSELRDNFGDFIEEEKEFGYGGAFDSRHDFTYQELRQKAQEFLESLK